MAHARYSGSVKRFAKSFYVLTALLFLATASSQVVAQSPCDHVSFHLADTRQTVDQEFICRAAEPWAGEGIHTFILLTDYAPSSQKAWNDYLDRAEAAMNLRDLSQEDAFNVNVLALEASTAGSEYSYVTIGEALFDTRLDSDDGREPIVEALQNGIKAGAPTEGFIDALLIAYGLNHPATTSGGEAITEEAQGGDMLAGLLPLAILLGVLLAGAYYLYPRLLQPALAERRQGRQLDAYPEWEIDSVSARPPHREPLAGTQPSVTQAQLIGAVDALLAKTDTDFDRTAMEEE